MYKNNLKIGDIILVSGLRPGVGTSTSAAMLASVLSARGEKTLLLSLDSDVPFDAASLLSDDAADDHLDEMVVLENSNGLNDSNIQDYVTFITENLAYSKSSTKISRLTKDPARTINHIMDIACYQFRFVVLDMGYANIVDPSLYYEKASLVLFHLTQDGKGVATARDYFKQEPFGDNMYVVPLIANFVEELSFDDAYFEKLLKFDCVFAMNHDPELFDMCNKRDIANFCIKNIKEKTSGGKQGLFGRKKKMAVDGDVEINPSVNGYNFIADKVLECLVHEEPEEGKA